MSIEAVGLTAMAAEQITAPTTQALPAAGFSTWFSNELNAVNATVVNAEHGVQRLAVGETANLHEVMINMEQAKLSFQLLAQVRNHLLDAYQEVMRMQV